MFTYSRNLISAAKLAQPTSAREITERIMINPCNGKRWKAGTHGGQLTDKQQAIFDILLLVYSHQENNIS
jgi:hypothetical protein